MYDRTPAECSIVADRSGNLCPQARRKRAFTYYLGGFTLVTCMAICHAPPSLNECESGISGRTAISLRVKKLMVATVLAAVAGSQALLMGSGCVVAQSFPAPEDTRHNMLREAMLGLLTAQTSIPAALSRATG